MMSRRRKAWILLLLALALPPRASAEPAAVTVQSGHYELHWQGSKAEAEEMSRVLEAAWKGFGKFFDVEPLLAEDLRLLVRFFSTREAMVRAIREGGGSPPVQGGGYYCPRSRTAYLYRQPTRYYTRCLLIHEACHQFHFLACTNNRTPGAPWYTEGVVEHLCLHTWDGKTLTLGVLPLSLKDYAGSALRDLESGGFSVESLLKGAVNRPVGAMLVRYLIQADHGRRHHIFLRLASVLDRGENGAPLFRKLLGPMPVFKKGFVAWLRRNQEPWAQVFNEWERVGPGRFRGSATKVTTAARARMKAKSLAAILEVPARGAWCGGLLLHFQGPGEFSVALVNSRKQVKVERYVRGKWSLLFASNTQPVFDKTLRFSAVRMDGKVVFSLQDQEQCALSLPGSTFGLALRNCTLFFRDVKVERSPGRGQGSGGRGQGKD